MQRNTASQKITLLAIDTAAGTQKTGDAANITAYVSQDDGSVTVLGDTSATELDATNAKGLYSFDLTQAETNADKLVFSGKSSTSGVEIVPVTVYTRPAGFSAGTANVNTATTSSGAITSSSFGAGAITASAIADGAIDRATFAADTGLQTIRSNTAQAGASGSITLDASASSTTDFYKGRRVYVTGGTGAGQDSLITAYNGTTKVATVTGWVTSPDNTSTFAILPNGGVLVERISDVNAGEYAWMAVDTSSGAVTVASGTTDFYTGVAGEVWSYNVSVFGASADQAGTKIKNALQPTTAGRTVDVTATGAVGIDWGNVENQSTSVNLNATTTNLVNTVTTLTNAPSDSSGTTTLLSRVTAAVATATALATAQNDLDILTGSDGVTLATSQPNYAPATSAQATTIAGYLDTEVAAILAAVDTEVAAIKAKTDNLPASPAASGDIPSAATISTQVNSDLTTAHGAGSYQTATSVTVSDKTGFKLASDGLDSVLVESSISAGAGLTNDTGTQLTSINARQAMALIASACGAVLAGAAGTNITMKPAGKPAGNNRIDATVTADGNRTAVNLKVPD